MVESRVCWRISRPGQQATAREKRAGAWTMANPRADRKVVHVTPRPQLSKHRHKCIPSAPPLRGTGNRQWTLARPSTAPPWPVEPRAVATRHQPNSRILAHPSPSLPRTTPATIPPTHGSQSQPPLCRSPVAELSRLSPDPDYMRPRWPGPPPHSADYSPPSRSSSRRMGSSMRGL